MIMEWLLYHLAFPMLIALMVLLFMGYPVAFVLGGVGVMFGFVGWLFGEFNLVQFFNFIPRIWGGVVSDSSLVAIPMFVLMGCILERSQVAAELLSTLQIMLRRVPGGLAVAVVLMGTIMAATTGIVGASVTMLCVMAMPMMLKQGYSKELASGTIAASGTLGILLPPSIMLIIIADIMSTSVSAMFAAAIGPSLMLSFGYALWVVVYAMWKPDKAPALSDDALQIGWGEFLLLIVRGFLAPSLLILSVLGSILAGVASPSESAGFGVIGALFVALISRKLSFQILNDAVKDTIRTNGMIFFIMIGATVFAYVFRALGGDEIVADILSGMGVENHWVILIIMMVFVAILGIYLDWIEICFIVLPLFLPILSATEFAGHLGKAVYFLPWLGVLLAVNLQNSFISPPVGGSLFFLKGAAPAEVTLGDIYRGIIPFMIIQLAVLGLCILFPDIVLYIPVAAGVLD